MAAIRGSLRERNSRVGSEPCCQTNPRSHRQRRYVRLGRTRRAACRGWPAPTVTAHVVSCVLERRCVARWPNVRRRELEWLASATAGARYPTRYKFSAGQRQLSNPTLYTVEGRQAGDLRQKCGSALIRKAKLPARSCGRPCLLAGTADRPHLSASAPQGGGSCVASWSSMTTGTLAWR